MKLNIAIAFGCLFAFVYSGTAQTKIVTNADLEKFRTKRVAAEHDLRENYARLGFPSPEEAAKQDAADAKARLELVQRLQAERLERERISAQYAALQQPQVNFQPQIVIERQDAAGYLFGYSVIGHRRIPWRSHKRFPLRGSGGWRAAGGMIMYDGGGNSNTIVGTPNSRSVGPIFRSIQPAKPIFRN